MYGCIQYVKESQIDWVIKQCEGTIIKNDENEKQRLIERTNKIINIKKI